MLMLDLTQLTRLTEALEKAVLEQDTDEIQQLCLDNNDFIFSVKPQQEALVNQKIKRFIETHQSAIRLIQNAHKEVQFQLFQSIKARKNLGKYKGVKHAK
jgi:hypothetical protein